MVYRVFVEKKAPFRTEAAAMAKELRTIYRMDGVKRVRVVNRYDAEGLSEDVFERAVSGVFSEPQVDEVSSRLDPANADLACARPGCI